VTHSIGGATPCDTQCWRPLHAAQARGTDGSAPRDTEPKRAPAAWAAIESADRRVMRGHLSPFDTTTFDNDTNNDNNLTKEVHRLTQPTYS